METTAVGQTNSIRRHIFPRLSEFRIFKYETNENIPQTSFTPQMRLQGAEAPPPGVRLQPIRGAPEAPTADLLSDR